MASTSTARPSTIKSGLTPRESAIGTPGIAADSPERANKRARFNASTVDTPREAWTPGQAKSDGEESEGVRWVKMRISEMQRAYKEAIVSAALIMQHRVYSRKLGMPTTRVPQNMIRRLERARARYEAMRRHVESYLLQCAQAAATPSKPLTSLPTPGTLPGLTPLPITPHPLGANALLGFDPSNPTTNLEKLAAQQLPTGQAFGSAQSLMDVDGGIDISTLGMAELNALINGDGFDFAALANAGITDTGLGSDPMMGSSLNINNNNGMQLGSQEEADQLLAVLGEMEAMGPGASALHDTSKLSAETIDSLIASLPGGGMQGGNDVDFSSLGMAGEAGLGELDLSEFAGLFESTPGTAGGTPGGQGLELGASATQSSGFGAQPPSGNNVQNAAQGGQSGQQNSTDPQQGSMQTGQQTSQGNNTTSSNQTSNQPPVNAGNSGATFPPAQSNQPAPTNTQQVSSTANAGPAPAPAPAPAPTTLASTATTIFDPSATLAGAEFNDGGFTAPGSGAASVTGMGEGDVPYDLSGFDAELGGFRFDDYFGDGTIPATDGDEFESMFAEFK